MADLDIRKLGVTLRSTSGTMAFAEEIYDETQQKFQSAINAELQQAVGNVSVPVTGVKSGDKILALADKNLSATLTLTYEQKSGDSAKKIYLNGIGGATIASIDATDFVKDKVVSSAELVETAESGVNVEVPYIKLVFNDASTPIRFSVKSLVDVYTGANLKLSTAYSTTTGTAPANGVSVDAAIKNVATRLGTVESKKGVDSVGGKTGAITLNSGATTDGAVNFTIDTNGVISATTVLTGYAKTADVADTYATKTALQDAQKDLGDKIADNTTNIGTNTSNIEAIQSDILSLTESTGNALTSVSGGTATGSPITVSVSAKSNKSQTITATAKTVAVKDATADTDGLATAKGVQDFVTAGINGVTESVTANTTEIANALNSVTTGTYITVGTKTNKSQSVSAKVQAVSTSSTSAKGLAEASDVKTYVDTQVKTVDDKVATISGNYLTATVASETEYDEWDTIVGAN